MSEEGQASGEGTGDAREENKLIAERRGKLAALREQGNPFSQRF